VPPDPVPPDEQLRCELLAMRDEDLRVRKEVVEGSSAFAGYHPRMEEVHHRNAARLREIIAQRGWPGTSLAGEDGAAAAWLVVQHAISEPDFQRWALGLLRDAAERGEAPAAQAAFLEDRICTLEGRPQIYGTQFDVDETGLPAPCPIADAAAVNERRRRVGLNTLEERTQEMRAGQVPQQPDPQARAEYERGRLEWLRRVGWRV
jgi:hypothetical protein